MAMSGPDHESVADLQILLEPIHRCVCVCVCVCVREWVVH